MQALLRLSAGIDAVVAFVARVGAWCGFVMILVVCFDVITRYFGVPKPFGLNSTQVQESEYWLHTILFALVIGYGYTRQTHIRIDLVRERLGLKVKYAIEVFGILVFLMTYAALGAWFTYKYAYTSFLEDEVSKSVIGLTNIWLLKSVLPVMFALMGLAGISQLIKSVAGLAGALPEEKVSETLGGDH